VLKQSEASVARLNRQWSMVREINRQILHARSEKELFANACRIVVELGGFRLAWVGLVTADGLRVEPVERCGRDAACLDGVRVDVAETEYGHGPVARAVRDGLRFVVNDLTLDHDPPRWCAAALAVGHRSVAALPLRKGGRVVGALSISSEIRDAFDDEQVSMLVDLADDLGHVLDVLEGEKQRRDAETALRSSEERYRAVFQQAFEGIFAVAPSHAIVDANESACRMLGYSREELLTLTAEHVIHAEDLARVPIRFARIPPGGVVVSERRWVRRDGSIMAGELSTKALTDGNFQVVVRDVTERKQVQAQLLLTDRLSSLGRLASGVAHEINNPLAYVMLNLEMLDGSLHRLTNPADPEALLRLLSCIDDARDGAERMRRIVRALSTFGRGDEERIGPVDVNAVLDSAVEIASIQLRHRTKVVRHYGAQKPARANAFRLGQVFLNLLVNAADALPDGNPTNEIVLTTRTREDGWIVIDVEDNGAGVPAELQSRIFDPFFTTKAVGKGTGLGLAVCHAIVTSVDGEITCESRSDQGTRFRVALRPASAETLHAHDGGAVVAIAGSSGCRGRVLVADDDVHVARALAATLAMHEVVVVTLGRDALARARAETFDCIVCDLMMPDLSGVEVHAALQKDGHGVERRIVFVTGGAVTDATRIGLTRIDNRVLEKPVDGARLCSVVGATVDESVAARERDTRATG